MQSQRAREIVSSLGVIDVLYQGESIWIESLHGEQAVIQFLESSRKDQVPVDDLFECP